MKLRILRPVYVAGEVKAVGDILDIGSRSLAAELVHNGKAERVDDDAPAPGPMTTETAPAVVPAAKPRKK